uniref:Phorbol-ester/DAG-type domain-containing protein n=1 Tax=Daucus carota subsp. sativus TaxID=79200 RepID=A0A161WXD5_DAUCS
MQPYKFPYEFETLPDNYSLIIYTKISSSYLFRCDGCNQLKSGIYIATHDGNYKLDIVCATLPSKIKHEAFEQPLVQVVASTRTYMFCDACGLRIGNNEVFFNSRAPWFTLHAHCAFRPHKLNHPWDSHALTLITPEDIIEDHPQDFNCEHCSDDIDANYWFYHCSLCDLSCHMKCINKLYRYSNINFNASGTQIEQQKLHEHGLTLVLSKRKRCCASCSRQVFYAPVFHCTTCNFIICPSCVLDVDASLFE